MSKINEPDEFMVSREDQTHMSISLKEIKDLVEEYKRTHSNIDFDINEEDIKLYFDTEVEYGYYDEVSGRVKVEIYIPNKNKKKK